MSRDIYLLNICDLCADLVLGMTLVKVSYIAENKRCDFCKKKKTTYTYRVMVNGKGDTNERLP